MMWMVASLAGCGDDVLTGQIESRDDAEVADTSPADTADTNDSADAPAVDTVDTTPAADTMADSADTTTTDTTDTVPADTTDTVPADTVPADTIDTTPADTSVEVDAIPTGCAPAACERGSLPDIGTVSDWRHPIATGFVTLQGGQRHRGRDLYLREGDDAWALAKFAYGAFDDDLVDEDVDIWLLRDCADARTGDDDWELLGTATTTDDGDHDPVEGVEDSGGWVYFPIPKTASLGLGRHLVLFVVRGDHSLAEQRIEVLPADAKFVVSDVDGTQTESEMAEFTAVFLGTDPAAQPHGAEALWAFAARGYHIFYLTARPEWLTTRTHEWLLDHGYPPGLVHTTMTFTGSFGNAAIDFKSGELAVVDGRFADGVRYAIGNTDTDEAGFQNAGVPNTYLYQFDPTSWGTRIDDYATLVPIAQAAPDVCTP